MKNNFLKFGLMTFFALFYALPLLANPGGTGDGVDEEDELPIDNWSILLVLAGVALGVYLITKYSSKKSVA